MKIHLVTLHALESGSPERTFLVRAHTKAGAERHIQRRVGRFITAKVPTQQELVDALKAQTPIEDATAPDSTPTPPSQELE
jgi:hypothetical protein